MITADELKEAMKKGPVKFSYRKKDGSIREAEGTLNPDLLPKKVPAVEYLITDVKWCDDETLDPADKRPASFKLPICEQFVDVENGETVYSYTESLIADLYGQHDGFQMHEIDRPARKPAADMITYYDLTEGHVGWRSFHQDQLIG